MYRTQSKGSVCYLSIYKTGPLSLTVYQMSPVGHKVGDQFRTWTPGQPFLTTGKTNYNFIHREYIDMQNFIAIISFLPRKSHSPNDRIRKFLSEKSSALGCLIEFSQDLVTPPIHFAAWSVFFFCSSNRASTLLQFGILSYEPYILQVGKILTNVAGQGR